METHTMIRLFYNGDHIQFILDNVATIVKYL